MDDSLTWAVVLATFLGPIFAVLITRLQDGKDRVRRRRAATFRTLMATRGALISPDHVGALNTVEVDFYGVKPVEEALDQYISHLNTQPGDTEPAKLAWYNKQRDLLAVLLGKMAAALGITKSEIHIRQGGYYPTGWGENEARQKAAQSWIISLSEGKAVLPVKIIP